MTNSGAGGILRGKVAIVTGGASGIGRATAMLLARERASVVIADVNHKAGTDVLYEIVSFGGHAVFEEADVSRSEDCARVVNRTQSEFGALQILFNNAGITRRANVVELDESEWDRVMNVNARSVLLMSKFAIPLIAVSGGGSIINTASGWGLAGGPRAAAYCA
jgi:NAD(P)-dependent dehydrogenase (short-subunit alcohol dehydrogenase family)